MAGRQSIASNASGIGLVTARCGEAIGNTFAGKVSHTEFAEMQSRTLHSSHCVSMAIPMRSLTTALSPLGAAS